ncbi:cation diffusion facilitator family transporter [Flavobacterium sp.]|uniref:cation diffusion facilitator family transporter n=1 Tax=Flavobacterium sp. TaxID=239 RepID=UPI0012093BA5|nr:cation diffusion facilitator family transporter [Flavobacterium sp.]RZJ73205.1 MAG: cation transporter [Flavobacterium sp.]
MSDHAKEAVKTTYLSILGNLVLAALKFTVGYFGNSYALIADAIESTSDVFSSFLVLLGLKYSSRPADENHPYGHGKAEALITFCVVGFLVVSATVIAYESIEHIQTPHKIPESYTLIVLAGIVIIKEVFYRVVSKKSEDTNSSSLKADAWHHRSDAITSGMAFIGISIAIFFGPGYETADDWAALLASGFIIYNAYLIFRPALGEILDENLHHEVVEKIRVIARKVPGVIDTEKLHVRKSGMKYLVDLHLTVNGDISVTEGHDIAHDLKDKVQLEMPEVADVLVHVEPHHLANL